jgi:predicted transcriptional regulator
LGVLEGEILRLLWEAGEGLSSVQVYDRMFVERKNGSQEMQSPSTIAVTLSRMVEKGLLTVERKFGGGKGYYSPTKNRADVVVAVMGDAARRLTGRSLADLLKAIRAEPSAEDSLADVIEALRKLQAD